MSGNNKILFFLMAALAITGCQTTINIPRAYNFKAKEIKNNPYGCWTTIVVKPEGELLLPDTTAGELLFVDVDTLYLLVGDMSPQSIYSGSVLKAELFTHKNMAGNYLGTTAIFLIPNIIGTIVYASEYGGAFLAIGVPVTFVGLLNIISEGSGARNVLKYPEKSKLENFSQFARYPAGRPINVNLHQLRLKQPPPLR